MVWFIVAIIVVALFLLLRKKPDEQPAPPVTPVSENLEDDELMVVLAVAVAEFEGTGDFFKVLSVSPRDHN